MPVVINEFEVIGDAARPQANAPAGGANDKPKQKIEPAQLEVPLARLYEQHLRVWVH